MNKLKYTSAVIIFALLLALSSCTSPEEKDKEDKTEEVPVSVSETSSPETSTVSKEVPVTSVSVSEITSALFETCVSVSTISEESKSEVSEMPVVSDTEIQSGESSVSVKDTDQTEAGTSSDKHGDVTSAAVTTEVQQDVEINENGELVLPEIFF